MHLLFAPIMAPPVFFTLKLPFTYLTTNLETCVFEMKRRYADLWTRTENLTYFSDTPTAANIPIFRQEVSKK